MSPHLNQETILFLTSSVWDVQTKRSCFNISSPWVWSPGALCWWECGWLEPHLAHEQWLDPPEWSKEWPLKNTSHHRKHIVLIVVFVKISPLVKFSTCLCLCEKTAASQMWKRALGQHCSDSWIWLPAPFGHRGSLIRSRCRKDPGSRCLRSNHFSIALWGCVMLRQSSRKWLNTVFAGV